MRIYKNAWFAKFARKEGLDDAMLRDAVQRADNGLIDAQLGSGLIKQRVARQGEGRSGGYRTLLLFRAGERAVFVFGFANSGMANLDGNRGRFPCAQAFARLTSIGSGGTAVTPGTSKRSPRNW